MTIWIAAFSAAALCSALLGFGLARGFPGWQDIPNERSLHTTPVPRVGGVFVLGSATVVLAVAAALTDWPVVGWTGPALAIGVLILAATSLLDDRRSLPILPRLLAHLGVAAAFVAVLSAQAQGLPSTAHDGWPTFAVAVALVLFLVWMTNLTNFMDGADGLVGGVAAVGFAGYAALAAAHEPLALPAATLSGALIGFLRWNWHPARVFLGDAGSVPLGFAAGGIGLAGAAQGLWPVWAPAALFLPLVFDATLTIASRAAAGKRVWEAHREHAYQRLILRGADPRIVSLIYGTLALAGVMITVVTVRGSAPAVA